MTAAEEVKARTDIVDLISSEIALKRSGSTYKAPCPFHSERTPSFVVNPERQSWHCFGACSEGGDVFSWEMKRHNVDFREALRRLAERAGVELRPRTAEQQQQDERRERLLLANDAAMHFWRGNLHEPSIGRDARDYLQARGISIDAARQFNLGVAVSDSDALVHHLSARGHRLEDAEAAGLIISTERGPLDRFRDRLIFPIRNARSETVGFGGRTLIDEPAKYINTPESGLFRKRDILYGLDLARAAVRETGRVIIVEGYTDVISAHEFGTPNTVASMGTALTETQIGLLKPIAADVRLALDPDAAGQAAARRGIATAREALGAQQTVSTDFRRIGQLQQTLSNDIRIIPLPDGRDPDDLIRAEPDLWRELVETAPPFLDWLLDHVRGNHDMESPRGRSDYVAEVMPTIRTIGDAVLREEYTRRVAAYARVERGTLASDYAPPTNGRRRSGDAPVPQPARTRNRQQTFLLHLAIRHPSVRVNFALGDVELVEDSEDRVILNALADQPSASLDDVIALNPDVAGRIRRLARDADELPPYSDDDAVAAMADAIARIRKRRTKEGLRLKNQELQLASSGARPDDAARAAALLDRGGTDAVDDPDLLQEALNMIQFRDEALRLHRPPDTPAPSTPA